MSLIINGDLFDHQAIDDIPVIDKPPYKRRDRVRTVTQMMFHEPCGPTAAKTEATLRRKGYGTQLHVTEDAGLLQFGDLRTDVFSHAGRDANERSIGIEVQGMYYPTAGHAIAPWVDVIRAPWAHKGWYVVPTLEQLELCVAIVDALTSCCVDGIEIPREWPTLGPKGMWLGARPVVWDRPGILSHMVSGVHADGSFIVLFCYLRLLGGMSAKTTREVAMGLATRKVARVQDVITS